jgi:Tol biopolymer transport system component
MPSHALFLVCGLALITALCALVWELAEPWRNAPPAPRGQIVLPARGGIGTADPATGQIREIFTPSPGATVTASAWSPDRQSIAFALFHRRPEDRVSSGEIFVFPANGGEARSVVERDVQGAILDTPSWTRDGQSLIYGYQGIHQGRPIVRIERVSVPTGERLPLYENASFPALGPDGRALAFVRDERSGQSLALGYVDGQGAQTIVAAETFVSIMGPRFSPDGERIAFTAVGPGPKPDLRQGGLFSWLAVPVAEAHGEPWNVWSVRPDGSELRRVGWLQEDEPLVSWSPDGRWLAIYGTGGLWLVDPSGNRDPTRVADGGFGAIDWVP